MFSSRVMGLKLLPTTVLHHRHTGEIVISLLLMQDLIAVVSLIVIAGTVRTISRRSQSGRVLSAARSAFPCKPEIRVTSNSEQAETDEQ